MGCQLLILDADTIAVIQRIRAHGQRINDIAFAAGLPYLASASVDQTVRVWNVHTGHQVADCMGHTAGVNCVAFIPDGTCLASGSSDATIRFWDPTTGREQNCLRGHLDAVHCVGYSSDGRAVLSGSKDRTLRWWAWQRNVEQACLYGHENNVNRVVIAAERGIILKAGDDGVRLWSMQSSELIRYIPIAGGTGCLALAADQTHFFITDANSIVQCWNLERCLSVAPVRLDSSNWVPLPAVAVDGSKIACETATQPPRVVIWHIEKGTVEIELDPQRFWGGSLEVTPDGDWIVAIWPNNSLRLWNPSRNTLTDYVVEDGTVKGVPVGDIRFVARTERLTRSQLESETVIEDATSQVPAAWWPWPIEQLAAHPAAGIWVGVSQFLFLFKLEQDEQSPGS